MGFGRGRGFSMPGGRKTYPSTFYAHHESGHLRGIDADYDTCHDLADGLPYENVDPDYLEHTYRSYYSDYAIQRGIFRFDTSSLPDNCLVTGLILNINWYQVLYRLGTHYVYVVDPGACGDNMAVGDFGALLAATTLLSDPIDVAGMSASTWEAITLLPASYQYVNRQGITKIGLRLDKDINDVQPSGADRVLLSYRGASHATLKAYINVQYEIVE